MKNSAQLMNLIARAERGALLPGEAEILRDAIKLLDDMATTLDKLFGEHDNGEYETTSTQSMRVVEQHPRPWREDPWPDVMGGR